MANSQNIFVSIQINNNQLIRILRIKSEIHDENLFFLLFFYCHTHRSDRMTVTSRTTFAVNRRTLCVNWYFAQIFIAFDYDFLIVGNTISASATTVDVPLAARVKNTNLGGSCMQLYLKGKTALVTGSTSGIGKAIAMSLVAEGAAVLINGRREEKVNQTVEEIQTKFPDANLQSVVADLGTEQGCRQVIEKHSEVDILINNLGIFEPVEYFDIPDEDWFKLFETNIMSGVRLTRRYLKQMIQKKEGRVIFIASEAAIMPSLEMAHYSATKTMQLSLSRSLAELTKGTNVTVNTVMPGSTLTEGVETMLNQLYPNEKLTMEEAEKRFMKENRPTSIIQRLIRPEEIAHLVTFLSSPLSSAINGSALRIDGGLVRSVF